MTVIEITASAAAVIAAGAYLRWAVTPVRIAYHVGREAERLISRRAARRAAIHQ